MPDEFFRDHRDIFVHLPGCADHFPIHFGRGFGRAAVNLPVKLLHNLRAALLPPDLRRRDLLAVFQNQRIGKARVNVGLGLVIVRGIRRIGITVGAAPDRRDVQQVHDPLVILLGRELHRRRRIVRGCRCALLASAPRRVHKQRQQAQTKQPCNGSRATHGFLLGSSFTCLPGHRPYYCFSDSAGSAALAPCRMCRTFTAWLRLSIAKIIL